MITQFNWQRSQTPTSIPFIQKKKKKNHVKPLQLEHLKPSHRELICLHFLASESERKKRKSCFARVKTKIRSINLIDRPWNRGLAPDPNRPIQALALSGPLSAPEMISARRAAAAGLIRTRRSPDKLDRPWMGLMQWLLRASRNVQRG